MTRKPNVSAAEICLYGAPTCGYGYIAKNGAGTMFGNGEPAIHRGMTDALWYGMLDLAEGGELAGTKVTVYGPDGTHYTEVTVGNLTYIGQLTWKPCEVVKRGTLMAEDGTEIQVAVLGAPK